jgi:plasmid maintenance system antidote protein VapI
MTVSGRVLSILKESGLNQKKFAESIYVTGGYVSRLLKNSIGMSNSTAMLIEKVYGYSKDWILHGTEPKKVPNKAQEKLTPLQRKIITEIESMTEDELSFILIYIETSKKKKEQEKRAIKNQK